MKREPRLFLEDIVESIGKIEQIICDHLTASDK